MHAHAACLFCRRTRRGRRASSARQTSRAPQTPSDGLGSLRSRARSRRRTFFSREPQAPQGPKDRTPTRANPRDSLECAGHLREGQIRLVLQECDQPFGHPPANRRTVAAPAGERLHSPRLAMSPQDPADRGATDRQEVSDLLIGESLAVERPNDRFAQLRWSCHPNGRSQCADHINCDPR